MRAGALDRRIYLCRNFPTVDPDYGEMVDSFHRIQILAADVTFKAGGERHGSSQKYAEQTLIFTTRWLSDVRPVDVIEYRGALYDITWIEEIGRRQGLRIAATCRVGQ
jgi:head-tail adaptor